jgi:hypothetical protein
MMRVLKLILLNFSLMIAIVGKRAVSVRDFLVQQGISINSISARGFGKAVPIASNDTAAGRQRNRRVEMIVAGDVIGIPDYSDRSATTMTRTPAPCWPESLHIRTVYKFRAVGRLHSHCSAV